MAGKEVVLDIETQNTFQEVGDYNPAKLSVSLVGIYRYENDAYEVYMEDQLPEMFKMLEQCDRVIGYNSISFDMGCLNRYYAGELLDIPQLDLMLKIQETVGFRPKLDDVAHATLGIGKSGHGLDAIKYWRNGEIDKLKKYCLDDVRITKEVYEYGLKTNTVKISNKNGHNMETPVDFTLSKEEAEQKVNLTLGF